MRGTVLILELVSREITENDVAIYRHADEKHAAGFIAAYPDDFESTGFKKKSTSNLPFLPCHIIWVDVLNVPSRCSKRNRDQVRGFERALWSRSNPEVRSSDWWSQIVSFYEITRNIVEAIQPQLKSQKSCCASFLALHSAWTAERLWHPHLCLLSREEMRFAHWPSGSLPHAVVLHIKQRGIRKERKTYHFFCQCTSSEGLLRHTSSKCRKSYPLFSGFKELIVRLCVCVFRRASASKRMHPCVSGGLF